MENVKSSIFICFILIFIALSDSAAAQQQKRPQLRQDEVRALKEIAKQVGKNDWDFSKDPCSGEGNWSMPIIRKGFESSVTCDCTFDQNSTCHVISIALKSQNLTGRIPQEFSKFRHLTHLDLSRNDFNGSIPLQWGKMNLVDLSVMGNRLSGPFPEAITKMNTLVNLSLEGNQFSGPIPSRIRSLVNLEKFVLSSNAFTGDLPVALSKLTSLIDLRLSDNNFTGQIPDYIGNWTQIEKLHFQGCSIKGPIPSSISALTKLADLRISDLTGGGSTFPALSNLKSLKVLVLRSCLLQGQIPDYIGDMKKLKTLDLSFNNLTGRIPDSFSHLTKVDFLYLTGNDLTGRIPRWIVERNKNALVSSIELHYSAFLSLFSSSFNIAVRYLIQVRTNQKRGNLKRILTSYQKPIIFIWFLDQQCTALVKQAEDCKHQKGVRIVVCTILPDSLILAIQNHGTVKFDLPGDISHQSLDFGTEAECHGDADMGKDVQFLPPLQIVILIVGTRGDVQPFVAIGKCLQSDGHRVRLATHSNFKEFVRSAGLEFYPLRGDPKVLAAYMVKNKGFLPSGPSEVQVQRHQIKDIIFSLLPACTEPDPETQVRFKADAIIANPPHMPF